MSIDGEPAMIVAPTTESHESVAPMDALVLAIDASTKTLDVLRYMACTDWRLTDALKLVEQEFSPFEAATLVREASVILNIVAEALKTHSLSPAFPRPGRKQIRAAVKALEIDAARGSAAWQAI
jgi:hypothetical protein